MNHIYCNVIGPGLRQKMSESEILYVLLASSSCFSISRSSRSRVLLLLLYTYIDINIRCPEVVVCR